MRVLRSEQLQKRDGFLERLNTLARTVRHIGNGLAVLGDGIRFGAMSDEEKDHVVITSSCRVMQRRETLVIGLIDVDVKFVDQIEHARQPASGCGYFVVAMDSGACGNIQRRDATRGFKCVIGAS